MGTRQRMGGPLLGNVLRIPVSRQTASRCEPSHCGQSSASTLKQPSRTAALTSETRSADAHVRAIVRPAVHERADVGVRAPAAGWLTPRLGSPYRVRQIPNRPTSRVLFSIALWIID